MSPSYTVGKFGRTYRLRRRPWWAIPGVSGVYLWWRERFHKDVIEWV